MAFEYVWLFREIELNLDTSGPMTLTVSTELPESDVRPRLVSVLNTEITTVGRRTMDVRLPGTTRGHLLQLKLSGSNTARLYGVRVFARPLNAAASWNWYPVQVRETGEAYLAVPLPIRPTPEVYGDAALPITPTPEPFAVAGLPIRETKEGYGEARLPIPETPEQFAGAKLPIAGTPEGFGSARLPVRSTPDWQGRELPIRPTPLEPDWVSLPVDAIE